MKPKYSLGQNFLKNPAVVEKIITLARVGSDDKILEIGPGTGVLTNRLVQLASLVIAVEKDDELFEYLAQRFQGHPGVVLKHGDILEYDLNRLLLPGMKVVANLPYNIATQIILRLAEVSQRISSVVVMVQKEVALRMCASPADRDYSALSVLLAADFDCVRGFIVGPESFSPRPRVDSMVVRLVPKDRPIPGPDREAFQKVVFAAFGNRRKMLRNSLMNLPGIKKDALARIEIRSGISLGRRPQELSLEEFFCLSRAYRELVPADSSCQRDDYKGDYEPL